MLHSEKIASSESKYMRILEEFFSSVFNSSLLPSHGIDHHKRVWYYAKEIMKDLDIYDFQLDKSLSDKLIIASFLHDSGMSVNRGFRHGIESRKICERFLKEKDLSPLEFSDVLDAIENHDNKEYAVIKKPGDLLTILSVADDLDAFGFIGIYRYLEIYLARNKPLIELGDLINENSEGRFQNFLRTFGFNTELVEKHSKRYEIISSFFNLYNQQVPSYKFDNQLTAGYCGVAEVLGQKLHSDISDIKFHIMVINHPDPVIQWFFSELNNELAFFK
jgi:HD superfamily phosphodiesterase